MKTKTTFKIVLDFSMLILMLFLTFGYSLSPVFHEFAGISIGVMYITHLILNAGFIQSLFLGKLHFSAKNILNFVLDILLFLCMTAVVVTGIIIGREVISLGLDYDWVLVYTIHTLCSYISLGIMGLHLLMHAKYILACLKGIGKNFLKPAVVRALTASAAIVITASIVYAQFFALSANKILPEKATSSAVSAVTDTPTSSEPPKTESRTILEMLPESSPEENSTLSASSQEESTASEEALSESSESLIEESPEPAPVSLDEYLGKLFCTGCGKHCSLLSPRCGNGEQQAASATQAYYEEYEIIE